MDSFSCLPTILALCRYIRLYESRFSTALYPHADPLLSNTSQVELEVELNRKHECGVGSSCCRLIAGSVGGGDGGCRFGSVVGSQSECASESKSIYGGYVVGDSVGGRSDMEPAPFPLFGSAPYTECILRPGEMLYIPPGCWHYVRSLSTSFSVSFWWDGAGTPPQPSAN
jgi:hypothetical protein